MADEDKLKDPADLDDDDAPIGWDPNLEGLLIRVRGEPKPEDNLIVLDPEEDDSDLPEDFNEYEYLLNNIEKDHLPGRHNQKTHGSGAGVAGAGEKAAGGAPMGSQRHPAVGLFDRTVAREGIPTPQQFFAELPAEKANAVLAALQSEPNVSSASLHMKNGKYTPERQKVHKAILKKLFTKEAIEAAKPPEGEAPTMVMLGGRGGSGKSWLTSAEGPAGKRKSIVINPDDFKEALPGYNGRNAGALHQESGDITSAASKIARRLKVNVVHDATMRSPESSRELVEMYKKEGYNVEGHYMFASPKTAATRAVDRFMAVGRLVPPSYTLSSLTNEASFDSLIPEFSNWSVYDNNEQGGKPKLVARGRKKK